MAATDEPRINAPAEHPSRPPRKVDEDPQIIRVPRLLVAASEISWRLLVCVAAGALVFYALTRIGFAVLPVAIALLLATLFVPPARWLERRGLPRALATAVVFITGLAALAGVIALMSTAIAGEADTLRDQIRGGADELGSLLSMLPLGLSEQEIQSQIDRIDDRLRNNSGALQSGVISGAQAAGQFLAGLVITLVVLFFFVKDGAAMWRWFVGLFPDTREPALDELGQRSWWVLTAYVRGVVFVAAFDAVGIGLALWLIGVPLVVPLAVITFVFAFIPVVGSIIAGMAAVLVALVAEGSVAALLVLGAVLLVQQLEGNVMYPLIVGRTVKLHPVAVLLAVTIGGLLYGIVGAALAVPLAVVAAATIKVVDRHSVHGEVAVGPPPVAEDPA